MGEKNIKIGSRILSDDEACVLLPSYELIYEQIDDFTQKASESSDITNQCGEKLNLDILSKDREFLKHHNNVFSILGARGTGKTSVLLTIKYRIENNEKDGKLKNIIPIVLPTIVPDDMEQARDIIGWILGSFKPIVDKYDSEYAEIMKMKTEYSCSKAYKSDISKKFEMVLKYYQFRKKEYYDVIKDQYMGKPEYVDETTNALVSDRELVCAFDEFIDELIKSTKNKHMSTPQLDKSKQPMIFIFFDDVDLSNHKCTDVLNTILRYLSNKNIIVFVGGDYKQFVENLTLNYLKTDNLLTSELMRLDYTSHDKFIQTEITNTADEFALNKPANNNLNYLNKPVETSSKNIRTEKTKNSAMDIRKKLSADFIKKVLSPATRYELQYLNNDQKAGFIYIVDGERLPTLLELLNNRLHLKLHDNRYKIYFEIFDKTPRGLINIYYYLFTTIKQIKSKITLEQLGHFINILVNSNDILIDYKSQIEGSITFDRQNETDLVSIDYKYNIDFNNTNSLLIVLLLKFIAELSKANKIVITKEFSSTLFRNFLCTHFNNRMLFFPNNGFDDDFYMELLYDVSKNEYIIVKRLNEDGQNDETPIAQYINLTFGIARKYSEHKSLIDSFDWVYRRNSEWVINIYSRLISLFPLSNDFIIQESQYYINEFKTMFKDNFSFDLSEFEALQTGYGKNELDEFDTKIVLNIQIEAAEKACKGLSDIRLKFINNETKHTSIPNNIVELLEYINKRCLKNEEDLKQKRKLYDVVVSRISITKNSLKNLTTLLQKLNNDSNQAQVLTNETQIREEEISSALDQEAVRLFDVPIEMIKKDVKLSLSEQRSYYTLLKEVSVNNESGSFIEKHRRIILILLKFANEHKDKCEILLNELHPSVDKLNRFNPERLIKAYVNNKGFNQGNYFTIYTLEFNQIKARLDNLNSWVATPFPNEMETLQIVSKCLLKLFLTYALEFKCDLVKNRLAQYESEISKESSNKYMSNKNMAYKLRFDLICEIMNSRDEENAFVKWYKFTTYTGKDD